LVILHLNAVVVVTTANSRRPRHTTSLSASP